MQLKTIFIWAFIAFLVWWIINSPSGAANAAHNIGSVIDSAGAGLSHFFGSL